MGLKKKKIASLWKRILAYIIDIIIINIIIVGPFLPILNSLNINFTLKHINTILFIFLVIFVIALISIFYWSILEYKIKQSVGSLLFNLEVNSKFKKLKFWQCFVSNISKPFSIIFILDLIYFLFNKKQRYFEMLSKTELIEK